MGYFQKSNIRLQSVSKLLNKNIFIPSRFAEESCIRIKQLYFLESKPLNSLMVMQSYISKILAEIYRSGKCKDSNSSSPWYWKFHPSFHQSLKPSPRYQAIVIDNSIQWKEDIFVALELQLAFGLDHYKILEFPFANRKESNMELNPYRIDVQGSGLEGSRLNVLHLHQAFALTLIGSLISWLQFGFELKIFVTFKKQFHIRFVFFFFKKIALVLSVNYLILCLKGFQEKGSKSFPYLHALLYFSCFMCRSLSLDLL